MVPRTKVEKSVNAAKKTWEFKVCLLGKEKVGKTSLMESISRIEGVKIKNHNIDQKKVGVSSRSSFTTVLPNRDKASVCLELSEIAANVKSGMLREYTKDSHCILIAFDVNTENCLQNIKDWIMKIKESIGNNIPPIVLIRTQFDVKVEKNANLREIKNIHVFASDNHYRYFATSAEENKNIKAFFEIIGDDLYLEANEILKARAEQLKIVNDEIERIRNDRAMFDSENLDEMKMENLQILHNMYATRPRHQFSQLILSEWGNTEISIGNSNKKITRYKLMDLQRKWYSKVFNFGAHTTSSETVYRLGYKYIK